MKMTQEDFDLLERAINQYLNHADGLGVYNYLCRTDLTAKRMHWDFYWATGGILERMGVRLYEKRYTDDHLDTALRRILPL